MNLSGIEGFHRDRISPKSSMERKRTFCSLVSGDPSDRQEERWMKLFEPYQINRLGLKNRLVMAPMSCNLTENGFVTERMIRFYEERAKGGAGLITIGDGIVDSATG